MRVKRKPSASGPISIKLKCLNSNYASAAQLTAIPSSPNSLAVSHTKKKVCGGGICNWQIPGGEYDLVLSAAADLIPGAQEGDVFFEVSVSQAGSKIPPTGNSSNPEKGKAKLFLPSLKVKRHTFFIIVV